MHSSILTLMGCTVSLIPTSMTEVVTIKTTKVLTIISCACPTSTLLASVSAFPIANSTFCTCTSSISGSTSTAPVSSSTSASSNNVCPSGNPNTLGADCSATGQCCDPFACDASTNKCVPLDGGTSPSLNNCDCFESLCDPLRSLSCPLGNLNTLDADCSATDHCCDPFSCDASTLKFTPNNNDAPPASGSNSSSATSRTTSSADTSTPTCPSSKSFVGADCSVVNVCCAPLAGDVARNICNRVARW